MTFHSTRSWVILVVVVSEFTFLLSATLVTAAVGLVVALRRFHSSAAPHAPAVDAAWLSELSVERYIPMLRLLDESDFRFLRVQPGFTTDMAGRLRAQRYRMFLAYLGSLQRDFEAISSALKFVVVHDVHDRPDLSSTLLRAHLAFAWGFVLARFRAYGWRLGCGTADVRGLLTVFDGIQFELRSLAPNRGAA